VVFDQPRVVDYRADVDDIATGLRTLLNDPGLRQRMGAAAEAGGGHFDHRTWPSAC